MGDTNKNPSASGVIHESLQSIKQSSVRLFTELREIGQKSANWGKVEPILNRVEGAVTNFFTKPEAANITEVRSILQGGFKELNEVCTREEIPQALPYLAATDGMMTSFLQQWQNAH